jgi:hypothetical protein
VSEPVKVYLSRDDVRDALVYYAAQKSGVKYPLRHRVEFNGIMMHIGSDDEALCIVELEHLDNMEPIRR